MGRYVFRVRSLGGLDPFNSLKLSFPPPRGTKNIKNLTTDNFEKSVIKIHVPIHLAERFGRWWWGRNVMDWLQRGKVLWLFCIWYGAYIRVTMFPLHFIVFWFLSQLDHLNGRLVDEGNTIASLGEDSFLRCVGRWWASFIWTYRLRASPCLVLVLILITNSES